jgi:hypothetical protein
VEPFLSSQCGKVEHVDPGPFYSEGTFRAVVVKVRSVWFMLFEMLTAIAQNWVSPAFLQIPAQVFNVSSVDA